MIDESFDENTLEVGGKKRSQRLTDELGQTKVLIENAMRQWSSSDT